VTSNRRWREEEFLIGRGLTGGIKTMAVKLELVTNEKSLYPGYPFPIESAWSEGRYWVYCYNMPEVRVE